MIPGKSTKIADSAIIAPNDVVVGENSIIEENVEIKAGMLYSSIGYSEDSNTLSEGFHSKHYKNNDELIF